MRPFHRPVMLSETLSFLKPEPGGCYLDCTLGLGGHALAVAETIGEAGILIGMDRDAEMLSLARETLRASTVRAFFVHADFREAGARVRDLGVPAADAALLDLGVSSVHLDDPSRGFAFRHDAPLDMRLDRSRGETAADMLGRLRSDEIVRALRDLGDERYARGIARQIVRRVEAGQMRTTGDLAEAVQQAVPAAYRHGPIHPATRTFMAVRILVNEELEGLEQAIEEIASLLSPNGRLVVLSYHSHEDRAVKRSFQRLAGRCECPPGLPECRCGAVKRVEILTRKPVLPTSDEVSANPRARSAKLRAAMRVASMV